MIECARVKMEMKCPAYYFLKVNYCEIHRNQKFTIRKWSTKLRDTHLYFLSIPHAKVDPSLVMRKQSCISLSSCSLPLGTRMPWVIWGIDRMWGKWGMDRVWKVRPRINRSATSICKWAIFSKLTHTYGNKSCMISKDINLRVLFLTRVQLE